MWDKTKAIKQSKQQPIDFEDMDIVVNWNKVDLNQDDAVFKDRHTLNKKINQQTLFRTYFTNKTDQV